MIGQEYDFYLSKRNEMKTTNENNLSVTAWALTTRAELKALIGAVEQYFIAHDTGTQFEQRITMNYLSDRLKKARDTYEKGLWDENT